MWWGLGIALLCMFVYYAFQPNHSNQYIHFVLQAQSWLEGHTSIPLPGYQDVQPILDQSGNETGQGIIPFPPLPAWVLLPFVAIWHVSTNQQLLSAVFGAIDVALAYWMLGFLPVSPQIRRLTALFLGLGTVLWYTSAIGTTWFWAHIVAVFCLLISVGLALSADREATELQPIKNAASGVRHFEWPGGWRSVALIVAGGVTAELMFVLAGSGSAASVLAAVGVLLGLLAASLAVVVAGRPGALTPFVLAVAVVGGLPALLIAGSSSKELIGLIDAALAALIVGLWWFGRRGGGKLDRALTAAWSALSSPEVRQIAAGIFFGLAVTARLTVLFGLPFFILVGGGGNWMRRAMLAGAGAAVPIAALLVVTYATTGHLFNPAYDYLYHLELGYTSFGYNPAWSVSDIRYIPQNIATMLFGLPRIMPDFYSVFPGTGGDPLCVTTTTRGLFDRACPIAEPNAVGTSIFLTSPAFFAAFVAWRPLRGLRVDRATAGATIAVVAIATANLAHFSQGWVQFGYRFSNDFVPFALILVALGASRLGRLWPFIVLVGLSILVNIWGTYWGISLGW